MLNDIIHLPLRLRSVFLWPFISWHLCSWRILSRLILDSLSRRTASRCDVTSASMVARSRKILLVVKLKCSLNEYLTYFAENFLESTKSWVVVIVPWYQNINVSVFGLASWGSLGQHCGCSRPSSSISHVRLTGRGW